MKSRSFEDVEICVKMTAPISTHTPFATIPESRFPAWSGYYGVQVETLRPIPQHIWGFLVTLYILSRTTFVNAKDKQFNILLF